MNSVFSVGVILWQNAQALRYSKNHIKHEKRSLIKQINNNNSKKNIVINFIIFFQIELNHKNGSRQKNLTLQPIS